MNDILDLADKFLDMGKISDAIECISEGLALYPNSPELYDTRAIARFKMLEIDTAIDDLHQAIRYDPTFHLSYSHLSELYSHKTDYNTALKYVEKALEIEPQNQYYKGLLAFVLLKLEDYDRVILVCDEILAKNGTYLDMLEYRATAFDRKKEYMKAAIDLETVYLNDSSRNWLVGNIGYYYSKTDNIQKAKSYLEKAIQRDPLAPYPYNNLGYVYLIEKNYRKAHELINKSLEIDPINSYAFKNRALVYLAEKKVQEAIKALERAKELKFEKNYGAEVDNLLDRLKG